MLTLATYSVAFLFTAELLAFKLETWSLWQGDDMFLLGLSDFLRSGLMSRKRSPSATAAQGIFGGEPLMPVNVTFRLRADCSRGSKKP